MTAAEVLSVRVAMPSDVATENGPLHTGMLKQVVAGPIQLNLTGLSGDGWADLQHHGLEDQAICAYPEQHYVGLSEVLELRLAAGAFGENVVVRGQDETDVCIGDHYQWGQALLEVTKARQPCLTLNKVWNCSKLAAELGRSGRTGWYYRVLKAGQVSSADALELVLRQPDAVSVRQQWMAKVG
jgi:MOSC domain-containing protein YiiM